MTTPPIPEESPSAERSSSENRSIEIYLFHCGHGDTILVRLPDDRWGLIDCYLPEQYGVRRKFFNFIEEKNIRTLDFIFQTHPDLDHYHGMQAVIEYFLSKGEKIEYYIDTGLNARRAEALLQNRRGEASEYNLLQDKLDEWDKSKQVQLYELSARSIAFVPRDFRGQIQFVPIGPDPGEKRRIMSSDLRKFRTNPESRPEANDLSLVVVLTVKVEGSTLTVLLAADAGQEGLEQSLDYWKQYAQDIDREVHFDGIKVPHHGSLKSHRSLLCEMKRPGTDEKVAAVSAGTRRALPDQEVLRDYLRNGWSVMATTTRGVSARTCLPMMLADRGTPEETDAASHLICLSWNSANGLSAEPIAAKITENDLSKYQTAKI